jgi:hypothetical protein
MRACLSLRVCQRQSIAILAIDMRWVRHATIEACRRQNTSERFHQHIAEASTLAA